MITITFIGSDRYAVGQYSKEVTAKLANLWEVDEKEILFIAPEIYIYHKGVEQTSYQVLVEINAPEACRAVEKEVADFILKTAEAFVIHLSVHFNYYKGKYYQHLRDDYPLFITEENEVLLEEEEYDEDTEIYEGNIFENFEERLQERARQEEHDHDHCDGECCRHDHDHHDEE